MSEIRRPKAPLKSLLRPFGASLHTLWKWKARTPPRLPGPLGDRAGSLTALSDTNRRLTDEVAQDTMRVNFIGSRRPKGFEDGT
jgi:hypothetical protein